MRPETNAPNTNRHFRYVYDAWNRLVEIRTSTAAAGSTPQSATFSPLARYSYNGLHWRTTKFVPATVGATTGDRTLFFYNGSWQALSEETDFGFTLGQSTPSTPDVVAQQIFGVDGRGPDNPIFRREDRAVPAGASSPAIPLDGVFDQQAIYQLADAQGSIVSVVNAVPPPAGQAAVAPAAGMTCETLDYEPYGRSRRFHAADFNRSGDVTVQDIFDSNGAYFSGAVASDTNNSGDRSVQDIFDFLTVYLAAPATGTAPDAVSGLITANPYGYCGYYADDETRLFFLLSPDGQSVVEVHGVNGPDNGPLYHVRHRVYDPITGRWLQRDPAGFVDGMNLYEYCASGPIGCSDPWELHDASQPRHESLLCFSQYP